MTTLSMIMSTAGIQPARAIEIVLTFEGAGGRSEADTVGLVRQFEYAEEFFESVFRDDDHTIEILYSFDNLESLNAAGAHEKLQVQQGRVTRSRIRIDSSTSWFVDETPEDSFEFRMAQIPWWSISSNQRAWYNAPELGAVPRNFEAGYVGNAWTHCSNDGLSCESSPAKGKQDMLSVVFHEFGHALGFESSPRSLEESTDGDFDFDSEWVGGAELAARIAYEAVDQQRFHLANKHSVLYAARELPSGDERSDYNGVRWLPSHSDLLAMAAGNGYQFIDLPRKEAYRSGEWLQAGIWSGTNVPNDDEVFVRDGNLVTVSLPLPTPPVTVLNVDDGGFLWVRDSQSSLIALRTTRHVNVGKDGQGRLRIDGSRLTIGTSLQISLGGLGSGLVDLHDSNLNVTQQIAIGVGRMDEELETEPGRLMVSDSRVDVGESMLVGYLGEGVVEISGSSHVEMDNLLLGWEDRSYGSLNLDGGRVLNGGGATIGNHGTGFLNTLEGELGIGQDLNIGARAGGEGVVGLFGGQVNIGGDIFVGGSKVGPGGLGSLVIDRADVQVAGKVVAYPGAVVNLLGGRLHAESIDLSNGQRLVVRGGEIRVPRIDGTVEQQQGAITTVSKGGFSFGAMWINGDYVQTGGDLRIEIGGSEVGSGYAPLGVAGRVDLSGDLEIAFVDGFRPAAAEQFAILVASDIDGGFQRLSLPVLGGGLALQTQLAADEAYEYIVLSVAGIEGDYNYDGVVDAADYSVWRDQVGTTGLGLAADGDGDGSISQLDYQVWRANYGAVATTVPLANRGVLAPEAATGRLLLAALIAGHRRSRRSCCRV